MDKCQALFEQANLPESRSAERWLGWQMAWSYLNADVLRTQRVLQDVLSKLESQVVRNPDLPAAYRQLVKEGFAVLRDRSDHERTVDQVRRKIGEVFFQYWDRLNDPTPDDTLEQITGELLQQLKQDVMPLMLAPGERIHDEAGNAGV